MKKILLLKTRSSDDALCHYLRSELGGEINLIVGAWQDIAFFVSQGKMTVWLNHQTLETFDLIWLRKTKREYHPLAKALALYLEFKKINYFDRAWAKNKIGGDKLVNSVALALNGLPILPSFFCLGEKILTNKETIIHQFGFPLIVKNVQKHRGEGIFLLENGEKFARFFRGVNKKTLFLFQKFYPNQATHRLVVLGKKVVVWEKRAVRVKDFRNAAIPDGQEEFFPVASLPREMAQISLKAAKILDLQVAGVDLLFDQQSKRYGLLEVNRAPGFTTDLQLSPELPAVAAFLKKAVTF